MKAIDQLERFLSDKSAVYDFDDEYYAARAVLNKLKNPAGNWRVERHPWIVYYLAARKQGRQARDYARSLSRRNLRAIRKDYTGLGLFPFHVKQGVKNVIQ